VRFLGVGRDASVADLHVAKTKEIALLCTISFAP
jgi:hypothetical protein